MVELVNRSGNAAILSTEVVYDNDTFNYSLGLNPTLSHVPTAGDRGGIKGVYCIAKNLMAHEKLFIYLTKEDIEKVGIRITFYSVKWFHSRKLLFP
jgi:recombination protein RecT